MRTTGDEQGAREAAAGRLGIFVVGLGGAVATTAVAGIELLRAGLIGTEGLPLAALPGEITGGLAPYEEIVFGGWDLCADDLARAAATHDVLSPRHFERVAPALARVAPLPAVGNKAFCHNIQGANKICADSHRAAVEAIRNDLRQFRRGAERIVCLNLASTERLVDRADAQFASLRNFERALDDDSADISPAMIYAYAAICEGVPFGNFTPSTSADIPALVELAEREGVPVAGKDGKTGQTFMKTVIAPALRARALRVDGWFSTNILGNRDGLALDDQDSLASKIGTKQSVLDQMLGYEVADHLVDIRYYRPRGDNKEAWDNIDVAGFLGERMQIKINFLCKDSILAAPLVIEIARLLDLAARRGQGGVQEQLSVFFKMPMTSRPQRQPEHAFHLQERMLHAWLANDAQTGEATREFDRELSVAMGAGD